jgi:SAM-dependent methyltransferase
VASDLARYYVVQHPGEWVDTDLEAQQLALSTLRERAGLMAGVSPSVVRFVEDDISATALEPEAFDVIVSFEVLEHVRNLGAAVASMGRLLAPGGIAYHEYNPFFSVIGGHSLCTADMPWGHARLDVLDFERFLVEKRPQEVTQALRFYNENLNRMTLRDLEIAIDTNSLQLLALLPWTDRTLVSDLDPRVLAEVRRTYPTAELSDLLATYVTVVMRKP